MYTVIEDLLSAEEVKNISDYVLSANTQWTLNRFNAYNKNVYKDVDDTSRAKLMGLRHLIMQSMMNDYEIFDTQLYDMIKVIPQRLGYNNVYNAICQLQLPILNPQEPIKHVDMAGFSEPYKSCVYYVNDSDGPTVLYKDGKVLAEIHPKAGKLVYFDGNLVHRSTVPTLDMRCIINMCFN